MPMNPTNRLSFADGVCHGFGASAFVRGVEPGGDARQAADFAHILEAGRVLYLPQLTFELDGGERRFLSPHWLEGASKSLYLKARSEPCAARRLRDATGQTFRA